ncbi:magnesium/cobalt efflux protein [Alkalilimnicola ehrlichii]|uniref:Magnesium and cobalt efflux protein CorC n=1 Tax=Alkalilimnicola ehrlichii TaxID=351052 RepID=A0A3E0WXW1_9GAMM|nr:transporter associated domain-containing protein [Alkalilimnicola ehrlichii]RFA30265.1 magnesium/cobalt efflux protein [Alkalilimnicola ehrlichii]RFA37844.1 magnesium/cobalt efflux protein [Alkalilimnicola ehrlichii]
MSEDRPRNNNGHKGWLERLGQVFGGSEPEDRNELVELLRDSHQRGLMDADALAMIEGVLHVSELQARDIMIPRAQVAVLTRESDPRALLPTIVETGYSRFPVVGESRDDVIGILLAKDLLKYFYAENDELFDMRELLRPALFIPESKRLDALLKQFQESRHHLAVVVDEYGGMAGLVTIEDVIEQIVGEIDDEHDFDEDSYILSHEHGRSIVKALTPIGDYNEHFGTDLSDEEFDTIGGLVAHEFGHMPRRGESVVIGDQRLQVIRADNRRIHLLMVADVSESEARDRVVAAHH